MLRSPCQEIQRASTRKSKQPRPPLLPLKKRLLRRGLLGWLLKGSFSAGGFSQMLPASRSTLRGLAFATRARGPTLTGEEAGGC